jgi:L-methionine (R)-S-oxide reductase
MIAVAEQVKLEIDHLTENAATAAELMTAIVGRLQERRPQYNWVGFYMLDASGETLVLGPYVGAPTPHTRIPLNRGICGVAAATGKTVVVDDVEADPRYLACSVETKSEIVAPIFVHGKVTGELDVDSHFPAAFTSDDRELVEHCATLVGKCLEKSSLAAG